MKIKRSKFPPLYIIGLGFLNIFDGLIAILSLGFYTSGTTLPYVMNYHKKLIKKKNEQL